MLRIIARVFPRLGKLPIRDALAAESFHVLEEGVTGSITFRNYRAPGRYSSWRRQWFVGSLALTSRRMVGYGWRQKLIDVPYDHPALGQMQITEEEPAHLCIAFDAATFYAERTGTIEVRYTTPQAGAVVAHLRQYTAT